MRSIYIMPSFTSITECNWIFGISARVDGSDETEIVEILHEITVLVEVIDNFSKRASMNK